MTEHLHAEFVPGCYRCDLSKDEIPHCAGRSNVAHTRTAMLEVADGWQCFVCGERDHE